MPIDFTCPHCGHSLQIGDQYAGQTGPCVQCGAMVTIPGTQPREGTSPDASRPTTKRKTPWIVLGCGCLAMVPLLGVLLGLLLPAINSARERARGGVCLSNMRIVGMALHQYEATHGRFPPSASAATPDQASISWRTVILPQLEQKALYDQYDRAQPWDGPNNQKLHSVMLEGLVCPSDPPEPNFMAKTSYFVVNGEPCIFNGSSAKSVSEIDRRGDGLSNTLLVVESVRDPVLWLEPRDLPFDDATRSWDSEQSALGSNHPTGLNVIFADGRGAFLPTTIDRQLLAALLTINGREVVDTNQWRLIP